MGAARAERLGLVNEITDAGGAVDAAVALAERICANGPVAVRETMSFLADMGAKTESAGWDRTIDSEAVIRTAADTIEGVTAFFEKRPPQWTGR
jgi:enoyl-CoA hydratase/carnithine racemase